MIINKKKGGKIQKEVNLPQGLSIECLKRKKTIFLLCFSGPLGQNTLDVPKGISIQFKNKSLLLEVHSTFPKSIFKTFGRLIQQKCEGVNQGFKCYLQFRGVGYRNSLQDSYLDLRLGYSHPIQIPFQKDLQMVCPNQRTLLIKGVDCSQVHQKAAEIRSWRRPEPYKGKGIFYKDEQIVRKIGKKN